MIFVTTRRRRSCAFAAVAAMLLGLASRRFPTLLTSWFGKYPGDALWAAMIYFGLAMLRPRAGRRAIAALALTFSLVIETLKLYEAPWAVAIRRSAVGHLFFGSVFSAENVIAYALGIAMAWFVDVRVFPRPAGGSGDHDAK